MSASNSISTSSGCRRTRGSATRAVVGCARGRSWPAYSSVVSKQRPVDARIVAALQADAVRPERQQRGEVAARVGPHEGHARSASAGRGAALRTADPAATRPGRSGPGGGRWNSSRLAPPLLLIGTNWPETIQLRAVTGAIAQHQANQQRRVASQRASAVLRQAMSSTSSANGTNSRNCERLIAVSPSSAPTRPARHQVGGACPRADRPATIRLAITSGMYRFSLNSWRATLKCSASSCSSTSKARQRPPGRRAASQTLDAASTAATDQHQPERRELQRQRPEQALAGQEYFAFIKKRQEAFNAAWEAFKQSPRIRELLAYLTSKGIDHPYNENILNTAFSEGYNANKNNMNYLSDISDTELLERFSTSLNSGALGRPFPGNTTPQPALGGELPDTGRYPRGKETTACKA